MQKPVSTYPSGADDETTEAPPLESWEGHKSVAVSPVPRSSTRWQMTTVKYMSFCDSMLAGPWQAGESDERHMDETT